MSSDNGVMGLARSLRSLKDEWELDSIAGSRNLPDGHTLTLRWSGAVLEIEREDGEVVLLDSSGLR